MEQAQQKILFRLEQYYFLGDIGYILRHLQIERV